MRFKTCGNLTEAQRNVSTLANTDLLFTSAADLIPKCYNYPLRSVVAAMNGLLALELPIDIAAKPLLTVQFVWWKDQQQAVGKSTKLLQFINN